MVKIYNSATGNVIIQGTKTCPSGNAEPITAVSTPIYQGVEVRVRALATGGTYIGIGTVDGQPVRLKTDASNNSIMVNWADDLADVYVKCDVSSNAVIEYIGL